MNTHIIRFLFGTVILGTIALVLLVMPVPTPARTAPTVSLTFTVNSAADIPGATPGDGVCETVLGNGVCTFRASIQEAIPTGMFHLHAGADAMVGRLWRAAKQRIMDAPPCCKPIQCMEHPRGT